MKSLCMCHSKGRGNVPEGRWGLCYTANMNGQTRASIKPGMTVLIVLKQDQPTGKLTKGIVKDILTKSPTHPHGIKVRLESGAVGRVKEIVS